MVLVESYVHPRYGSSILHLDGGSCSISRRGCISQEAKPKASKIVHLPSYPQQLRRYVWDEIVAQKTAGNALYDGIGQQRITSATKDHTDIGILQNSISGIPLILGLGSRM